MKVQNFKIKNNYLVMDNETIRLDSVDAIRLQQYGNIVLGYNLEMVIDGGDDLVRFNDMPTIDKNALLPAFDKLGYELSKHGYTNFALIDNNHFINLDNVASMSIVKSAFKGNPCVRVMLHSGMSFYIPTKNEQKARTIIHNYKEQYTKYVSASCLQR